MENLFDFMNDPAWLAQLAADTVEIYHMVFKAPIDWASPWWETAYKIDRGVLDNVSFETYLNACKREVKANQAHLN